MNRFENWFCSSSFWRNMTRREVLPWLLEGVALGEHLLEIGAGPGAATEELRKRAARVTSLEYSHTFAARIVERVNRGMEGNGSVVQGDASTLPFPDKTFSTAIAVLVLHHLKSQEAQRLAFAEVFRVLRPGGMFLALDIPDGWVHRVAHIRSTFVPIAPASAPARLADAGFANVETAFRRGAFRLRARRPR
ncbi:MAG TPA: class I SAM-dependent methyltransferase [Candidatus Methylomirabilis sp.]|nr:class I SAM-dependent methyltransferase [Candidatus Methylomirabilis sp.]